MRAQRTPATPAPASPGTATTPAETRQPAAARSGHQLAGLAISPPASAAPIQTCKHCGKSSCTDPSKCTHAPSHTPPSPSLSAPTGPPPLPSPSYSFPSVPLLSPYPSPPPFTYTGFPSGPPMPMYPFLHPYGMPMMPSPFFGAPSPYPPPLPFFGNGYPMGPPPSFVSVPPPPLSAPPPISTTVPIPTTTPTTSPPLPVVSPPPPSTATSTATSSVKHKPKRVRLASKGSSTHFDAKLPKRPTRADTAKNLSPRAAKIYKGSKRGPLSETTTKQMRKRDRSRDTSGDPLTREARLMIDPTNPTLSSVNTQRNHIIAAETVLVPIAAGLNTLTTHGTSEPQRQLARESILGIAKATTGGDSDRLQEVEEELDEIDSSDEEPTASNRTSRLGALIADHPYNLDFGNSGRNMAMSNRVDVTSSPQRTSIAEKDAELLESIDPHFEALIGPDLTDNLLAVPMSPGGTTFLSSKTQEEPKDNSNSNSNSKPKPKSKSKSKSKPKPKSKSNSDSDSDSDSDS